MMIQNFKQLLEAAKRISEKRQQPVPVVVAAGQDVAALSALIEAQHKGLASGILVGPEQEIQHCLNELSGEANSKFEIINATDDIEIARQTVEQVHAGRAEILMKGKIKTSILFKAILDKNSGLRTGRLMSDVFVFEFPARSANQFIMITDGGINLAPDLNQKVQLIENAIFVAHALGNPQPKVAVLSAIETINPDLPATIDAAALSKMNQRGQIQGCLVDGPLALDNAISQEAARTKHIDSPVAGNAEILLCPNLETANILAKSTTYFANLPLAHICIGATVPVLIPSRSDSASAKLFSIALSMVVREHQTTP